MYFVTIEYVICYKKYCLSKYFCKLSNIKYKNQCRRGKNILVNVEISDTLRYNYNMGVLYTFEEVTRRARVTFRLYLLEYYIMKMY